LYESPSPLHPLCAKRQRASGTEDPDSVLEQPVYDHWKLNVLIDRIYVLLMTLTFFCRIPSTSTCPTIISSRSRGKGFSYTEEKPSPKKSPLRGIRSLNKMQQGIIRITAAVFFRNGETTPVLLRAKNARSSDPWMMLFQKTCKKHYGDTSKNITFFLLTKKKLAKMLC
jgi:hypothetical protein